MGEERVSRYKAISGGTPEGDRTAALAQKILDAIPEEEHRAVMRAAARWAAYPLIYGVPNPVPLEDVVRDAVWAYRDIRPHS